MSKPLKGKSVVVTRGSHQAGGLIDALRKLGAEVIVIPLIDIVGPTDLVPFDRALHTLNSYDFVVFTSANAVQSVANRMRELGIPKSAMDSVRLAAVGSATADSIAAHFRPADVCPSEFVSDAIPEVLGDIRGKLILLPRADRARPALPLALEAAGAIVTDVVAYKIVEASQTAELPAKVPDYILLASSETARIALSRFGIDCMKKSNLACIGPITAETVRELELEVACVAQDYTAEGLVAAIVKHSTREAAVA